MTADRVSIMTAGGSGMGVEMAGRLGTDGFKVFIPSLSGNGEALGGTGVTVSNQPSEKLKRLVDKTVDRWRRYPHGVIQ